MLRDRAGDVLRVTLGDGDVDCRPQYRASPDDWIVKAVVASEDGEFWSHCGVRPLSVARAFCQNIAGGRRVSGASTITMQTVRLIAPHRKSYFQKWLEAVRAVKMERQKDKLWIISQYLNRAPFGSNLVGIESAAQGWFGKGAKDLGPGEAAMLAGMVQAPSRFRPDRHYDAAMKRRDYVLSRMVATGVVDEGDLDAIRLVRPEIRRSPRPFRAPHYCDWRLAETAARNPSALHGGADIATPLDPEIQELCERAVASASAGDVRSAAVVVDVASGDVVAIACSGDYFARNSGQVNTAVSPRQAGSTLKPFLAALAIDLGAASPAMRLKDVPMTYAGYTPANYDGRFRGLARLDDSLVLSLNLPFVGLLEKIGVERFGDVLRSFGFAGISGDDSERGLGMAIGNANVTLVELTRAYATLAAIAASGGRTSPSAAEPSPISPQAAYLVSEALSGPQRSSAALGHVADVDAPRFAWKTGTSAANRDAWTVVWNPRWAVGVWCGHVSGRFGDGRIVGAKAAAPVAWRIARAISKGDGWFAEPPGIVERKVCALTGMRPGPGCPETETERTAAATAPQTVCTAHVCGCDGRMETRLDPAVAAYLGRKGAERRLCVAKPAEGAVVKLVPGVPRQKIVFAADGAADGERVWWFLDGTPIGETTGRRSLAVDTASIEPGDHTATCATASGSTAQSSFSVSR